VTSQSDKNGHVIAMWIVASQCDKHMSQCDEHKYMSQCDEHKYMLQCVPHNPVVAIWQTFPHVAM